MTHLFFAFFEEVADFFEESGLVFLNLFGFLFFFVFTFFGETFGAFAHFVEGANHEEDDKGDDEEVNGGLEEVAVVDGGGLDAFDVGGDGELEVGKIVTADDHGDDWHDDVVDEGGDNGGESGADNHTDGEVHD